jgi:hypothetical protein
LPIRDGCQFGVLLSQASLVRDLGVGLCALLLGQSAALRLLFLQHPPQPGKVDE